MKIEKLFHATCSEWNEEFKPETIDDDTGDVHSCAEEHIEWEYLKDAKFDSNNNIIIKGTCRKCGTVYVEKYKKEGVYYGEDESSCKPDNMVELR